MNFHGILIGASAFIIIGIFHPIVVKGEYYFGARIWPLFLVIGLVCISGTLFIENITLASIVGVFGFSSLWSVKELFEQRERVEKGWFPRNPDRKQ